MKWLPNGRMWFEPDEIEKTISILGSVGRANRTASDPAKGST